MLKSYREQHLGAGDLNTQIVLEMLVVSKDPVYHSDIQTWTDTFTAFAKVEESASAGEAMASDGQATYARPHRITIRWRPGVSAEQRVRLLDGRRLQIVGLARIGASQWLELSCVEWSHQQS